MAYSNKKSRNHKASYLVTRFLNSNYSYEVGIDIYDIAILKICAEMMDNDKESEIKTLYGCQETIAQKCRVRRQYINLKFKKYKKLNILKQITFHRGRSNKYILGDLVTYGKSDVDNYDEYVVNADL